MDQRAPPAAKTSASTPPLVPVFRCLAIPFIVEAGRPERIRRGRTARELRHRRPSQRGGRAWRAARPPPDQDGRPRPVRNAAVAPPPRNEALPGAGFRRDFRDGEITFRPCLHLGDGPLAPESGRSAPALVGCAVDHALPPRATVALGRCTDAEFLARQNTQDGGNGFPFAFELRFTRWVGACSPAMATS